MSIRSRLRALILFTLLPVAIFSIGGAYLLVERERETFERGARDRVRALITAVDAELNGSVAPLQLLASSPALQAGDLSAFRAEAERALAARQGGWVSILVSDPGSGALLLNLLVAPGAPLGATQDPASVLEAARRLAPTVSRVAVGPQTKRLLFAVRVPVVRDGDAIFVLSAIVDSDTIARLVERQPLPEDWAIAVLDQTHRFVARRPVPADGRQFASDSLKQALDNAPAGWERGTLGDGAEIYRAFERSAFSRWSISMAIPRRAVDESLRGLWLLFAGFAAATALGLWIALRLAARLSQPISALAAAAPALGRGDASNLPPPGPLDEVRRLSAALTEAARNVREREERQRQAEQALRSADRAKDEFLAMLGHELRNPLASISNAAQLLRMARDQPAILAQVSDILGRQVEHMARLVDDLLEVGRLAGGKVRLERTPLDLAAAASEVIGTWRSGGRFIHHEVRETLQPAWVSGDRARIEQVLTNLLDNALKYTPAGGRIGIEVRREGGEAVLEISDTGEGMSPELIARVFDLFVQGERTLARQPGGLGIGLTMVKRLVEMHDGVIRAQSAGAGRGAKFSVRLPAIDPPALAAAGAKPESRAQARLRMLLVEDNADARESLAALLRLEGHEIHVAPDGARGLEAAKALAPHAVLVDIGLPDMDGYELARRLRADPALRAARLVALTGYGTQEDRRRALAAGFDRHLAKPVDLETLQEVLR